MKYIILIMAVLLSAQGAYALETGVNADVRAQVKTDYLNAKTELRAEAEAARQGTSTSNAEVNAEFKAKREALKADLQTKLASIKDEAKKKVVLRVEDGLVNLNTRLATKFDAALDRLEALSLRADAYIAAAAATATDVAAATKAQAEAKIALADARAKATAQVANNYALGIKGEATLKAKLKETRAALHADLKAVQTALVSARQSLRTAVQAVSTLRVQSGASAGAQSTTTVGQ